MTCEPTSSSLSKYVAYILSEYVGQSKLIFILIICEQYVRNCTHRTKKNTQISVKKNVEKEFFVQIITTVLAAW